MMLVLLSPNTVLLTRPIILALPLPSITHLFHLASHPPGHDNQRLHTLPCPSLLITLARVLQYRGNTRLHVSHRAA